jgi:hypothetical protein
MEFKIINSRTNFLNIINSDCKNFEFFYNDKIIFKKIDNLRPIIRTFLNNNIENHWNNDSNKERDRIYVDETNFIGINLDHNKTINLFFELINSLKKNNIQYNLNIFFEFNNIKYYYYEKNELLNPISL